MPFLFVLNNLSMPGICFLQLQRIIDLQFFYFFFHSSDLLIVATIIVPLGLGDFPHMDFVLAFYFLLVIIMQFSLLLFQLKPRPLFELIDFLKVSLLHLWNCVWRILTCVLECRFQTIYNFFILSNILLPLSLTTSFKLSEVLLQFFVLKLQVTKLHFKFFRVIYIISIICSLFQRRLVIESVWYDSGYTRR